jgi:hypothetical protein
LIVFALGYSILCFGLFLSFFVFKNLSFSGFRHHRLREMRKYLAFSNPMIESTSTVKSEKDEQKTIMQEVEDWLAWCNYPFGLNSSSFMLLLLLYMVIVDGGGVFFFLQTDLYTKISSRSMGIMMVWGGVFFVTILLFLSPILTLRTMAEKRKRKLQRQFLHLINYFQVFLRTQIMPLDVIREVIRFIPDPLQKQLIQLFAEIQIYGEEEGFTLFAKRLNFRESDRFKNAIINSIRIGSDAAEVCYDLSKKLRDKHKNEKLIRIKKKPFFILLPKICFVVSILIIIIVPILDKVLKFSSL